MKITLLTIAALTSLGSTANAALVNLSSYNEFAVWDNLTSGAATAAGIKTGGHSTPSDWVLVSDESISATFDPQNGAASTSGRLGKVALMAGGGYFGNSSLYTANSPTTFFLEKDTSGLNVDNVVFQIRTGNTVGWIAPTLSFNGSSQNIAGTESTISEVTVAGQFGNTTTTEFLYQWDLSSISGNINEYRIELGTGIQTSLTEMSLASSDSFSLVVVPEPSSSALIAISAFGLIIRRKR